MILGPSLARWLLIVFVLMPPIGVNAALGIAPLLAIAAVGVIALRPWQAWSWLVSNQALAALLGAIGVLGAASALWSILPQHSLIEGLRFLTVSASGLIVAGAVMSLAEADRDCILRGTAISIIATVVVLAIDLAFGLPLLRLLLNDPARIIPLERFDRGTTVIGLLFWPIALGLRRERRTGLLAATTVALVAAMIIIPSSANRLALVVGAILWPLTWTAPRVIPRVMLIATLAVGFALPLAIPRLLPTNESVVVIADHAPWIKFTGLHRLMIWRFVSDRIAERPLLGWGIDASRELPGGHTRLVDTISRPVVTPNSEALPLHPHNAFLQWWVELGAVGALLGLAVLALVLRSVASLPSRAVIATTTAFAGAALTIAMLGYGFWQSWWLSTLWLAGGLIAAVGANTRQTWRS